MVGANIHQFEIYAMLFDNNNTCYELSFIWKISIQIRGKFCRWFSWWRIASGSVSNKIGGTASIDVGVWGNANNIVPEILSLSDVSIGIDEIAVKIARFRSVDADWVCLLLPMLLCNRNTLNCTTQKRHRNREREKWRYFIEN